VGVKFVVGNRLHRERIDREAYHAAIRKYYEAGIDASLLSILGSVLERQNEFSFLMIAIAAVPNFAERIRADIYSTLANPKGKIITGPVIFDGGTKLAIWEQADLDELRKTLKL
jgi:hypothetical protein